VQEIDKVQKTQLHRAHTNSRDNWSARDRWSAKDSAAQSTGY